MPPLQTFGFDTHYSLFRDMLWPMLRTPLGAGIQQARQWWERPIYQFRLQATHETTVVSEALASFYLEHGGHVPFWFSGEKWGQITTPIFVGWGTGAQTQFFLPNRHITAGTLTVFVNGSPVAATLTASSGLIVLGSAPVDDARLTATYQCQYKCVFYHEGELLMSAEEFVHQLFRVQGIMLREVVP